MFRSFIDVYFINIITSFSNSKFYEFNLTAKNGYKNLRRAMNKWKIGFFTVFFTNYICRPAFATFFTSIYSIFAKLLKASLTNEKKSI